MDVEGPGRDRGDGDGTDPVAQGSNGVSRVMVLEDAIDLCDDIASCGVATACMLLKDAFKNGGSRD